MSNIQKVLLALFFATTSLSSFTAEDNIVDFEWLDDDKEIYVLQNRKFRKSTRFNLSLLGTVNLSETFVDTLGGGLKGSYFFKENWGFEIGFGAGSQSENNAFKGVREQSALGFYRSITSYTSASLVWSPFYGKFNTFNMIYYLDWYLSFGLTNVNTEHNGKSFSLDGGDVGSGNLTLENESSTGLTWSTGFYWYLTKMLSIRFEFTGFHYKADRYTATGVSTSTTPDTKSIWFHNYNMSAGLNFMF